jgi:imidazolonepropionase-like amidohydrolase
MKYTVYTLLLLAFSISLMAQGPPAKKQTEQITIEGATLHVGNGTVIEDSFILIKNGKITFAGPITSAPSLPDIGKTILARGKHVYPGIIALNTQLGLIEVGAVRATRDGREIGQFNPSIRSIVAYNTDSNVTPTIRSNGILIAQTVPEGNVMPGQSSMVQLDAWNWEDAVIAMDNGLHINWPRVYSRSGSWPNFGPIKPNGKYTASVAEIETFFREAKAYGQMSTPKETNLKLESMRPVFAGKRKVFINADHAKAIMHAVNLANQFDFDPIIVGGAESHLILDFLKENKVSVILDETQRLPRRDENDVDLPYKLPRILHEAGVDFALSMPGFYTVRNLPFQAGQAVGQGLPYEEAVKAITLSPARIAGIDSFVGTVEKGKDGTLIISEGDVLDYRTAKVTHAFIQGREIDLNNKQTALYRKFTDKYESQE